MGTPSASGMSKPSKRATVGAMSIRRTSGNGTPGRAPAPEMISPV